MKKIKVNKTILKITLLEFHIPSMNRKRNLRGKPANIKLNENTFVTSNTQPTK